MTFKTAVRMPLSATVSQLYAYIYCMLLSSMMVDMPLYGGVMYLCGRAVMVFFSIYRKRNRKYLPSYSHRWTILLLVVLLGLGVFLTGMYPSTIRSEKMWVLFAAIVFCICTDGQRDRIGGSEPTGKGNGLLRMILLLVQAVLAAAMCWILIGSFGWLDGGPLAAGFLLLVGIRVYSWLRLRGNLDNALEDKEEGRPAVQMVRAYRTVEWISLVLVMAVELTVTTIYALLAIKKDWLLPAVVLAAVCTLVPAEIGRLVLRRTERNGKKDPTWLVCLGLLFLLGGIVLCILTLNNEPTDYIRVFICLAACSIGGVLSLTGLGRIEETLPDAVSVTGSEVPVGYWKMRMSNWELARLFGDVLALITLGVFCFVNRKGLPQNANEVAARFQPIMTVPVFLVIISALVSALQVPLSTRYIEKTRKLKQLQERGEENPALRRQVEHVVKDKYRQPYLSRFLILVFRLFYRHKVVNTDHIVTDDQNPLVFLCNHGEFYGPIVCKLYIPVPVRAWTISMMMYDQMEVTKYVYDNTFSRQKWPLFARKAAARFIGWLSVNVMNQIESIPVYRDSPMKLRETVRMSIDAMATGDNLLIFPENPDNKYEADGIGELSPGFVMLAEAYWKKTGKKMRFLPMYADKNRKVIDFGTVITYEPENGFLNEQTRIIRETEGQIRCLSGLEKEPDEAEAQI